MLVLSAFVYARGLGTAPATAGEQAIHAAAVDRNSGPASNLEVPWTRLFIPDEHDGWLAPIPVYATALVAAVAPSGSTPERWVAVAFGLADIVLVYLLAARSLRGDVVGFAAALVLLVTPAHVSFSRTAEPEGIWQVPFILVWMLGLTALGERPSRTARLCLAAGTASLATAVYAQPSAVLIVPVLLIVTVWTLRGAAGWRIADAIPASVAVGAALAPFFMWLATIPRAQAAALVRWLLMPADVRSMFRAATVVKGFWDFWVPSHLFLNPEARGLCGVFLAATSAPLAVGVYALVRQTDEGRDVMSIVRRPMAIVSVLAPMAAATGQPFAGGAALVAVPFGVLIAVSGAVTIWHRGGRAGRFVLCVVVFAAAVQAAMCLARA